MEMQPLVSVILVSYRHAHFLEECLDSLLAQTYKNWELIVADDASPDTSQQVIDAWLQKNGVPAQKVFHTRNTGLSRTLNECIALCNGKYIKPFAADDVMLPELLEKSVERLEDLGPDYGLCYSKSLYIDEKGKKGNEVFGLAVYPEGYVFDRLMENNFIPALNVLLGSDAVKKSGGFTLEFKAEDYDYWLRMAPDYAFAFINEALGLYRTHSENFSWSLDFDDEVFRIKIHHDQKGHYRYHIKAKIRDLYYWNKISPKLIQKYDAYPFKDPWLSFCLNKKLPYRFFRLIDKLFFVAQEKKATNAFHR